MNPAFSASPARRTGWPTTCFALACGLLGALPFLAAGPPARIQFDGQWFQLVQVNGNELGTLNEYVLQNETPDNWTQLIGVRLHFHRADPATMAANQKTMLEARFPGSQVALQTLRDGAEVRIRFIVSRLEPEPVYEFNSFRYLRRDDPNLPILSYQFAYRQQGGDRATFDEILRARLETWSSALARLRLPDPVLPVDTARVDALEAEGLQLLRTGQPEAGLSRLTQNLDLDPQNPVRHYLLASLLFPYARALLQQGDPDRARDLLRQSERLLRKSILLFEALAPTSRHHADAHFLLGEFLFYVEEDYPKAIESYQKAIAIDPSHQDAKSALGTFSK